ncbi:hypothetical protein PPSIR1_01627 [Plesiocystis pacifica SIR-1]|uniref:Peptidase S24/S26A/S26B/S26C domain-containing protein n=2 Tax=Plesiocystis pacifica TaxID=191768 RepID=A6G8H6_9BACT|nr:hypothetical protein PPSIR1_01627 [Plesiocystis pacifica SIR-1]
MEPTLVAGDVLWIDTQVSGLPELGSLVLIQDPQEPTRDMVKRVRSHGEASFSVSSDDPTQGRDSRQFGSLRLTHLRGRVVGVWSSEGLKIPGSS